MIQFTSPYAILLSLANNKSFLKELASFIIL